MKTSFNELKKGYTITELVVVMAVVAVIMSMVTAFIFFFSNQFNLNKEVETNYYSAITLKNYISSEIDKNTGAITIDSSITSEGYLFTTNRTSTTYLYKFVDNDFYKENASNSDDYEVLYTPDTTMGVSLVVDEKNNSKLLIDILYSKVEEEYEGKISFIKYIK